MRWLIFLFCLSLVACSTITPDLVQDKQGSYDASVPTPYNPWRSGFLTYTKDHNGVLISQNAVKRYNNLIGKYGIQFQDRYTIELKINSGIKDFVDEYGNSVFYIDKQHFNYFLRLIQWNRDNKDADSLWLKIKEKIVS